jgi:hypothetical protein
MTVMLKTVCPHCGAAHEAASLLKGDHQEPKEGDRMICLQCTKVCIFGDNGELRKPTAEEEMDVETDGVLLLMRLMVSLKRSIVTPNEEQKETMH